MSYVIKAENVSKVYQIGEIGTGTLSHDLERWVSKIRGKEDPFLKIGETNDRSTKGTSNVVWSLKDIDFEIQQGEAVGIIGRNGAGKSTLLKILSRVTSPTTGCISGRGRVASLLEVGTGFHPELTGRENIYLNGAILGMRKKEITRKFDEIVDFSGVERYIDTPVKRYSSGMYVRLAFGVAAHLDSEILIVDEVLAVGDAEFQSKCLGKMNEVSKGEGKTVLFVSHNIGSISQLCTKGMYLKNGMLHSYGDVEKIIETYVSQNDQKSFFSATEDKRLTHFNSINFIRDAETMGNTFLFNEDINIRLGVINKETIDNLHLSIIVRDQYSSPIFASHYPLNNLIQNKNISNLNAKISKETLLPGNYKLEPVLHVPNQRVIDKLENNLSFNIEDSGSIYTPYTNVNFGKVVVNVDWDKLN